MWRRRLPLPTFALLAALAGALPAPSPARGGEEPGAPVRSLSERYERRARLEVGVEEISGWTPLPGAQDARVLSFLAVSDEGAYRADPPRVEGALFVLDFERDVGRASDAVSLRATHAVTLHLGEQIPRLDPAWAQGGSMLDLEACVPLPGTPDLYLLAGERNPQDATDGGANRLYVVRYPAGAPDRAALLAYLRVPDLPDDTINDRFEAVVALSGATPDTWNVFAFKERTASTDHPPVYLPVRLVHDEGGFRLEPARSRPFRGGLPSVLPERSRLGAQADACVAPSGRVWVLDRWRREVHVVEVLAEPELALRHVETLDLYDQVADVPEERAEDEPAAPGGTHAGYGRHEAMCFDARGWLWLAADLGGGSPSVVTVLAPRARDGGER